MAKKWKRIEYNVTDYLKKEGFPARWVARQTRGVRVEDIECNPLSIELKSRADYPPAYMKGWMSQAERNSKGRIPMVVVHQDRTKMGDQLVILYLRDVVKLLHMLEEKESDDPNNNEE